MWARPISWGRETRERERKQVEQFLVPILNIAEMATLCSVANSPTTILSPVPSTSRLKSQRQCLSLQLGRGLRIPASRWRAEAASGALPPKLDEEVGSGNVDVRPLWLPGSTPPAHLNGTWVSLHHYPSLFMSSLNFCNLRVDMGNFGNHKWVVKACSIIEAPSTSPYDRWGRIPS